MKIRTPLSVGLLVLLAGFCVFLLLPLESYWPGALAGIASGWLDAPDQP